MQYAIAKRATPQPLGQCSEPCASDERSVIAQAVINTTTRTPMLSYSLGRMLGCLPACAEKSQAIQELVAETEGFEPSIRLYKRITV